MSDKSIRIRTTPNGEDKYLKLKLDQEFDFIEVLSLKITQEQAYRNFCSDYGVVVGRVIINSGFGVENAKVSVFIPIDDIDINNPNLKGLYPYEIVTDTDIDGKRYNLLPKYSVTDNECFTPVGSFPNKREVLDDSDMLQIYCKYYKFTTTTNYAGDFMLFGVPIGNHTIHVDVDISDIGIASQRPYDSISQGAPLEFFDSPTKFKDGNNLNKLVQIKTNNASANVQPFWGDVNNCEVGITRVDFDLNYTIRPSAIFMGGIYGDQDANSVNKNCRPRLKLGQICEQITGEGTIEMIRKTVDGTIEKFDIDGGRLISQDGSWAYQIPMNLDYMVTDEFGDLVPTEDTNKGIPTRASVRFKIGLDETGGLGRLRSRAKYLVPNNPNNTNEIDYEFGITTKDTSFRDLYWNKIYSVSNFINRFQRPRINDDVKNRNMCALKDVDDCIGDKNPVPFNRVNVVFNPLFFIICIIMKIIEVIMFTLNVLVIPILNLILEAWNLVMRKLCGIYFGWPLKLRPFEFACELVTKLIPCLYAICPDDGGYVFAPGCIDGASRQATRDEALQDIKSDKLGRLSDCISAEMARALNLFQFDFYNDWLNGSLYSYLVKYKKRGNKYKFCDQDCSGKDCNTVILMDTCFGDAKTGRFSTINEGVIKRYNGELYYAATNINANYKLYATEIINLGSVFSCDWQGVPKIQPALRATTYMSPPLIDEFDQQNLDQLEMSGQVGIGAPFEGMFFDIGCGGLSVNSKQCLNIRHSSEFGVDLDQLELNASGTPDVRPNHNLGSQEINGESSRFVRHVLFALNNTTNSITFNPPYSTDFNINNVGDYNFASPVDNGSNYVDFRGITNSDNNSFRQPKHSYFHYFGLIPGKTGLEKMNQNFFTKCFQKLENEFIIKVDSTTGTTQLNSTAGAITFTVVGGSGPFTYVISGPNGYTSSGSLSIENPTTTIIGLAQGSYIITVKDVNNNPITQTFEINAPVPLYANAVVSSNTTGTTSNGAIQIVSIGGGSGSYTFTLYNHTGAVVNGATINGSVGSFPAAITSAPLTIGSLSVDTFSDGATPTAHFGYHIKVTDSLGAFVDIWNLKITGTQPLSVNATVGHVKCYNSFSGGSITVNVNGGTGPYLISGSTVPPVSNNGSFIGRGVDLVAGTYNVNVKDGSQPSLTSDLTGIVIGYLNPEMKISIDRNQLAVQCDPNNYHIKFRIANGGKITIESPGKPVDKTYLDLVNLTLPHKVYYQIAKDEGIGAEDPATPGYWSEVKEVVVPSNVTDQTDIEILIPSTEIFANLGVRICTSDGACSSDFVEDLTDLSITEMKLAPTLEINLGSTATYPNSPDVNNSQQCIPNSLTFKFNVSHLMLNFSFRSPYTVHYRIKPKATGSITGQWSQFTTHPTSLTSTQQPITISVAGISTFTFNNTSYTATLFDIEVYLKDNVGCQSNTLSISNIRLPLSVMGGSWISDPTSTPNQCKKRLVPDGGIPFPTGSPYYSISDYPVYDNTPDTIFQVFCAVKLKATVLDSVGCLKVYNEQ